MKTVLGWVTALLLVIGVGVAVEAPQTAGPSPATRLDRIAVDAAAWAGDTHVTSVTWVENPGGSSIYTYGLTPGRVAPTYTLEVAGNFPLVVGGRVLHHRVIELTVDASTFAPSVEQLTDSWVALSGTEHTDSLTGIRPDAADIPSSPNCMFPMPVCNLPPCPSPPPTTTTVPGVTTPPPPAGPPWDTPGACEVTLEIPVPPAGT